MCGVGSFVRTALMSISISVSISSFCLWPGTAVAGMSRSGRFICGLDSFADRFISALLRGGFQQSITARRTCLASRQQTTKLTQRFHGDHRGAERKMPTLRTEHPIRQRAERAVGKATKDLLAMVIPSPLVNGQGLTEERMPTVVHCHGLKKMCIMWVIRMTSPAEV